MNIPEKIALAAFALVLIVLLALLHSILVMILWNWLMPSLFGLKSLTWLQAWGLTCLCSILFKSSISTKKD